LLHGILRSQLPVCQAARRPGGGRRRELSHLSGRVLQKEGTPGLQKRSLFRKKEKTPESRERAVTSRGLCHKELRPMTSSLAFPIYTLKFDLFQVSCDGPIVKMGEAEHLFGQPESRPQGCRSSGLLHLFENEAIVCWVDKDGHISVVLGR
jgi:hypothetical protein